MSTLGLLFFLSASLSLPAPSWTCHSDCRAPVRVLVFRVYFFVFVLVLILFGKRIWE